MKDIDPTIKINLRSKKRDFFTKIGKKTIIILPTEANTSSSNEKFNALWLSPDEWMIYFDGKDTNNVINNLFNEISKLNFGAITDISDHWVCINIKGRKLITVAHGFSSVLRFKIS